MRASEFIIEGNDKEFHTGGALGLPFPGSYEQEYNMFKRKGSRRITAMTNEEEFTFKQERRSLNIPELIKRGAIFITHPHGPNGWETDRPNWDFSLITLQNVLEKSPNWSVEYKKYIRPESYNKANQEFFNKLSDQKYQQILWSIKKLGIPNNVAFLDELNEALDSSYDYEGNVIGGRYFFETEDGVEYKVYFSGNNLVEVAFNASTDGGDTWKTTMIGTGNANKVFGTVIKIIQEYVAVQQPKALYFTADKDERGRVSLYKRLASQVDRALPNYVDAGPNDLGSGVAFMVKRKGDKINFSGEDDPINEVADSPYDYIQNVKTPAKRAYRFQTDNGQLYRVQVLNRETPDIKNFGINKNLEIHFDLTDMKTGKPNTGRTNTGDSIRVFSTVANILQKEVAEQKPTGIVIASKADDEGRVRLYKTLARRATKLMPDYVEAGEQTVTGHDGNQYITIQLKRKDLVTEKWSEKYKRSINCNNPKGFSQRAHCQGRKK